MIFEYPMRVSMFLNMSTLIVIVPLLEATSSLLAAPNKNLCKNDGQSSIYCIE